MLSQSPEQNKVSGAEIEKHLKGPLKETVDFFLRKYGETLSTRLGMTRSDLVNEMREVVWKGILTYNADKGANKKTYMNTLIRNRFLVLLKRSGLKKNRDTTFYADVFSSPGAEQRFITYETPETVFEVREEHMVALAEYVLVSDRMIYLYLILGRGVTEMVDETGMTRPEVVSAINRVARMLKERDSEA